MENIIDELELGVERNTGKGMSDDRVMGSSRRRSRKMTTLLFIF